jgi:hypothetical protein
MKLVQWSPHELETLHSFVGTTAPKFPTTLQPAEESASFGEAFSSTWSRENLTYEILRQLNMTEKAPDTVGAEMGLGLDRPVVELDPSWNPYSYIRSKWDDERIKSLEFEIRGGFFENVKTPDELEAKAAGLIREKQLLKSMETGPGLAVFLGGLAGAATDLTTYIPVAGVFTRARSLGTVSRFALAGAAGAAIPEVGLHHFQDLRTAEESFLNIGVAAALGGGLGTFARFVDRRHPMHPANPDNPLRPDNLDKQSVGIRTPEGDVEIIEPKSVGAAAAAVGAPGAAPGVFSKIPGINWLAEKITGATPAGRALQYSGTKSRELLLKMMDLGGILTDTARFGEKIGHSAEDLKRDALVLRDRLFLFGEKQLRDLNYELGQSDISQAFGLRGTVREDVFAEVSRKKLLGNWTEEDSVALAREYGPEAALKIETRALAFAERIHKVNEEFERELIELGRLRDPARVKALKTQIEAIDRQQAGDKAQGVEPREELKVSKEELRAQLREELAKPEPMGREYGHAQLWDPHTIMAKQEEFEDFLYRVLIDSPDEQWLMEGHGLTKEEFLQMRRGEKTDMPAAEQRATVDKILRDWAGDEFTFNIARAEARANAAREGLRQSELDLRDTMRANSFIGAKVDRLTLSEARKFRDAFNTRLEAGRLERDRLQAFERALKDAAEAARVRTAERARLLEPVSPERIARAEDAVLKAEDDLFVTISDSLKDPASRDRLTFSGEYVQRVRAVADANARLDSLMATPRDPSSPRLSRIEERAARRNEQLASLDRKVSKMEEKLSRVDAAYREVADKLEMLKKAKAGVADAVADARAQGKIVAKELKAALRELRQLQRRSPLDQVVSDIRHKLMSREELPHAILDKVIPETGRVKARRIHLTPEQRREAESLGLLRTDLSGILHAQYDQLAGFIGLHKGLDIRKGGRFESWKDVLRSVDDEYDLLPNAKPGERDKVKKDLNLLKDRLLGTENVGMDRDGWVYWMSKKVREANYIRFGAGFLLPSLTDVASVHLRTGSLGKLLRSHAAETVSIMKRMYDEHPSEFVAMVNATELGAQGVRMAKAMDAEDAINIMGIGPRGSAKHKVTSAIDRGARWLSDKTSIVSGMRIWNRFWKITAGIHRAYRLRDLTGRYASLSSKEKAELATLGIDEAAARRIHKMIEAHGSVDDKGHWDPNLDAWVGTREGRQAARDFRIAVERDMNRAVFTPGIGDTPGIMSHAAGKLWLQFQTFAFTFLNRFMIPASQRIATFRDAQALVSFAHLAWAGMIVVIGKDILNGRDPSERFKADKWADTTKEIVDRSGLMTYLSPYVDSALKLSGPLQEKAFGEVKVGPTSKYVRNSWSDSLLGAGFGLYRDMREFGSAASQGDPEKIGKKGMALLPWNFYWRLMHQLGTED